MMTVTMLQKRIVKALETGQDPAPILKELGELRAKIAAEGELAELQKVANERKALRDKAEAVKVKVEKQGNAIDAFLKARDTLVSQLQPLIEPVNDLAKMGAAGWEREPGECYIFNDLSVFTAEVRGIPTGYLPADFGCPFLEMEGGQVDALGKPGEALQYFMAAYGILSSFTKGISTMRQPPAEGLMAIEDTDNEIIRIESSCRVCSHPERVVIDKALQTMSLRDIEAEFNVPRSTLSRHKTRCLNLGAIRVEVSEC